MLSSVPHDTCLNEAVTTVSPGRPGASNSSVCLIRSQGASSRYSPPKEWPFPVPTLVNDIL